MQGLFYEISLTNPQDPVSPTPSPTQNHRTFAISRPYMQSNLQPSEKTSLPDPNENEFGSTSLLANLRCDIDAYSPLC
jgi:hypothetical protein